MQLPEVGTSWEIWARECPAAENLVRVDRMDNKADFVSLAGLRPDGRRGREIRRVRCRFGVFKVRVCYNTANTENRGGPTRAAVNCCNYYSSRELLLELVELPLRMAPHVLQRSRKGP